MGQGLQDRKKEADRGVTCHTDGAEMCHTAGQDQALRSRDKAIDETMDVSGMWMT
jgi:hypothetical protein